MLKDWWEWASRVLNTPLAMDNAVGHAIDDIRRALAQTPSTPDAVSDVHVVPFDTPPTILAVAHQLPGTFGLSTKIPTSSTQGGSQAMQITEAYAGTDKDAAKAAIDNISQGEAIMVLDGTSIPIKYVQALNLLGTLQGAKLGFNLQTIMVVFQIEQLLTQK